MQTPQSSYSLINLIYLARLYKLLFLSVLSSPKTSAKSAFNGSITFWYKLFHATSDPLAFPIKIIRVLGFCILIYHCITIYINILNILTHN